MWFEIVFFEYYSRDTSGRDQNATVKSSHFEDADAILIFVDVTDYCSLEPVYYLIKYIRGVSETPTIF